MQGALLAVVQPDNTPHGYNLTFAFPMLMFIVIAGALYVRFLRPHRVPGRSAWAAAPQPAAAPAAASHAAAAPEPDGVPEQPAAEPAEVAEASAELESTELESTGGAE